MGSRGKGKSQEKKQKKFKEKHPEGRKAYANAKNGHSRGLKKSK